MNQPRADGSRFSNDKVDAVANNCLFLVRKLRTQATRLHQDLFTSMEEGESATDLRKRIIPLCVNLNKKYDEVEHCANQLPDALDKGRLERLKFLFQDELLDADHSDFIDRFIKSTNYNEGNFQINYFLSTFTATLRRKNYPMIPHPVSYSEFKPKSNPHAIFEGLLINFQKEFRSKRSGVSIEILERNCTSVIFEIRTGSFMNKEFVCLQKAVVLENLGSIDKVIFYASHEDTVFMEDFGEKKVDLRISSRYEVFRRLSVNTNIILLQNAPISDGRTLFYTINWISKVYKVMETPCKVCKKVLKDFLPPTSIAFQTTSITRHESC